ncbi:Hypothetical protein SRAE_2000526400 [Strongyloides ratti]|uniref:Uncharacterized protein n=1 Tax=Strongyloides ratti TaxID=34506 RepID=A0A090LSQ8_STRRB|nr:Hypothetical protein SRAE_2000526400 [Strongyloides ratti]CEF70639.1 Hypothetical protein SRAE_2000526400 [Strongyloides ratti]
MKTSFIFTIFIFILFESINAFNDKANVINGNLQEDLKKVEKRQYRGIYYDTVYGGPDEDCNDYDGANYEYPGSGDNYNYGYDYAGDNNAGYYY